MARRLTLLALLACAAAARRLPPNSVESDSESLDPFAVWDEYSDSFEVTPPPRPRTTTPRIKLLLKGKNPKVNVTLNKNKNAEKKLIKTSQITIESYNNFIVTQSPLTNPLKVTGFPVIQIGDQYLVMDGSEMEYLTRSTTGRPQTSRRPVTRRRPQITRPLTTSRRPQVTRRSTQVTRRPTQGIRRSTQVTHRPTQVTRRPTQGTRRSTQGTRRPTQGTPRPTQVTRRPGTNTQRTTKRPIRRTAKPTKTPRTKKPTCPNSSSGWLGSLFDENLLKKVPEKPTKSGWFLGLISTIYNWILESKSWFGEGSWFMETVSSLKPKYSTTTPMPLIASPNHWFQTHLDTEENDGAYINDDVTINKISPKKSIKKNYKGYQLLRTYPDVQWKIHELLDLQEEAQGSGVMWWTTPSLNGSTDILVPPDLLVDIKDHLKSNRIDYDVIIWDLQKAIRYENPRLSKKQRIELEELRGHPMTWRRYHRYADILRYLEYLQHSLADVVELIPLGRSSEGLPLVAVKIALPANDTLNKEFSERGNKKWKLQSRLKPAVWVDGGAHALEWIAPAVATWMIHALAEGEKGLGADYEILKQADFYIMPVMNPDGYEHSHTHDRLWRKTRSRLQDHSDNYYVGWFPWNWGQTECVGVDADRNWDYHWAEKDSSTDPCADNYAGTHPFSEPETRAVSEFLAEHRGQIKLYLSLHAYSQAWLVPSSHALASFADDGVLVEMGKLATAALSDLYGTKYQVGTAAEIRQPASGMSHDWAKARAGIKYSYHVDLRDSYGPYGFLLPGSQIVSTARETWQAVKAIVDNLSPG